jgi:hypothetical protein
VHGTSELKSSTFDSHCGQANFSACSVWIYTQKTYSPEYITSKHTQKIYAYCLCFTSNVRSHS